MDAYWYLNSDNSIEIVGLKNVVSDTFIEDAVIAGSLYINTESTESVAFTARANGNGEYFAVIPAAITVTLTPGNKYTLTITITTATAQVVAKVTRMASYLSA
jgi:hypothetical protein